MSRDELAVVTRERDSYQRQLDAIGDALVTSLVKRIEPRLSRHPVTVIMAAGSLIAKIGEAIGCEFEDGDDLLEAVKELARERDEARADLREFVRQAENAYALLKPFEDDSDAVERAVGHLLTILRGRERPGPWAFDAALKERDEARADAERYLADLRRCASEPYEHAKERAEAFRRGAEAMREACAQWVDHWVSGHVADKLRDMPIPEEP